jgi:DNA-directed RNA polymerase specialized sigma subunit
VSTYTVHAKRWEHGWELEIHDTDGVEVGVTQARTIAGAERMVRDYLALDLDADPASFEITISPVVDDETSQEIAEARRLQQEAERAQRDAAVKARLIARRLQARGLTGADIARVLGVSPQRVSQLVKSGLVRRNASQRRSSSSKTVQ